VPGGADPALAPGLHAPARSTATFTPTDAGPVINVVLGVSNDGSLAVREVHFAATDSGREVRCVDLTALRLEDLVEDIATHAVTHVGGVNEHGWQTVTLLGPAALDAHKAVRAARTKTRRRTVTNDLLREVASVYRAALRDRRPPTEAVAEHIGKSHRTASDYLQRARAGGFLGPARGRGKAGEIEE